MIVYFPLHRSAGGKLRRVLKPNLAPGMVYKDGKVIADDLPNSGSSPRAKGKSSGKANTPKKREWLKVPAHKSPSKLHHRESSEHQKKEPPLKKHSSMPTEKREPKPSTSKMVKSKSEDDIDLDKLPSRRSSRVRDSKKDWKYLLKAAPDEHDKDPMWEQQLIETKIRSEARKRKRNEREQEDRSRTGKKNPNRKSRLPSSSDSGGESDGEPSKSKRAKTNKSSDRRKDNVKDLNSAGTTKKYAEVYDEVVLKRGSFEKLKRQKDWALAKQMLAEESKKAKVRKATFGTLPLSRGLTIINHLGHARHEKY